MSETTHRHPESALVTGGSRGIGLEVARILAAAGSPVTLVARTRADLDHAEAEWRREGRPCLTVDADVADPGAVATAFDAASARFGPVDLVVHCAGVLETGRFDEIPLDAYRRLMEINYLGAVHVAREAVARMSATGGGHLVLVASVIAIRTFPGFAAYAPSKAALRAFHETLAVELRGSAVRLSIVYPPITDTPMVARLEAPRRPAVYDAFAWVAPTRVAAAIVRGIGARSRRIFVRPTDRVYFHLARLAPDVTGRVLDGYVALRSGRRRREGRT